MIEQLIPRVIAMHTMALKAHWKTKSNAQHTAFGEFYEGIIPALDEIVETHQGMFGLVHPDEAHDFGPHENLSQLLREEAEWIEANRDIICSGVSAIGNLVDNLTAIYLKAAYKLEHLS